MAKTEAKTARFWIHVHGGLVHMSMRPGDALEWHYSEKTEEGWASEYMAVEHAGDAILMSIGRRERDCDGLFRQDTELAAQLDRLSCIEVVDACGEPTGVCRPDWQDLRDRRYDSYAEADGY